MIFTEPAASAIVALFPLKTETPPHRAAFDFKTCKA
jgi:hypothetical protein